MDKKTDFCKVHQKKVSKACKEGKERYGCKDGFCACASRGKSSGGGGLYKYPKGRPTEVITSASEELERRHWESIVRAEQHPKLVNEIPPQKELPSWEGDLDLTGGMAAWDRGEVSAEYMYTVPENLEVEIPVASLDVNSSGGEATYSQSVECVECVEWGELGLGFLQQDGLCMMDEVDVVPEVSYGGISDGLEIVPGEAPTIDLIGFGHVAPEQPGEYLHPNPFNPNPLSPNPIDPTDFSPDGFDPLDPWADPGGGFMP